LSAYLKKRLNLSKRWNLGFDIELRDGKSYKKSRDPVRFENGDKLIQKRELESSVVDPDPRHLGNLDPHPHQIKIRMRIKVISWIRNQFRIRINLQMTSQNVWILF
jgi:hypothetical protein